MVSQIHSALTRSASPAGKMYHHSIVSTLDSRPPFILLYCSHPVLFWLFSFLILRVSNTQYTLVETGKHMIWLFLNVPLSPFVLLSFCLFVASPRDVSTRSSRPARGKSTQARPVTTHNLLLDPKSCQTTNPTTNHLISG